MKQTIHTKHFVALARVSGREQEREGFSLDVQEEAFNRFAENSGGQVLKLFRIAETATRREERKTFHEFIAFAKKHAHKLDGILFYKIDRAARNLFDYADLERLECEYNLPFIAISQQTDNTPAGRMMRRTLAMMASFFTEQQGLDIREGLGRRVREGWFSCKAPYGYKNVRLENGRSIVVVDPLPAANVKRICELASHDVWTLESIADQMLSEGRAYRPGEPRFHLSKIHAILTNPAYCGLIRYKGVLYQGKHEPLITKANFDRIQEIMGRKANPHRKELKPYLYRGIFRCGECGCVITIETQKGHNYLRCTRKVKRDCRNPFTREESVTASIANALWSVAMHPDDANWMLAQLEQTQANDAADRHVVIDRLEASLAENENKLKRLAELYLSEGLKMDTYISLHNPLVAEKHRLTEQLNQLHANPGNWLERFIGFVGDNKKAGFLVATGSPEEKRDHFKKTGSNLQLLNRELRWEPRQAWQIIHKTLADQGCFAHNDEAACMSQAASSCGETNLDLVFPLKWS